MKVFFPYSARCNDYSYDVSSKKRWIQIATIATISSIVGGIIGYAIGYFFYKEVGIHIFEFYGFEGFKSFKEQIQIGKGFWAWIVLLAIAGFTPVPFKLLTISSGLIHFNFFVFVLVALLTRGSRFFILAGLLSFFGHKIHLTFKSFQGKL